MFIEIVSVKFCTPSACTERGRSLIYPEVEGAPIVGIGIGTELPHAQIEPARLFLGIVGGIARIVIGEHIDIADTGLVLSPWIEGIQQSDVRAVFIAVLVNIIVVLHIGHGKSLLRVGLQIEGMAAVAEVVELIEAVAVVVGLLMPGVGVGGGCRYN